MDGRPHASEKKKLLVLILGGSAQASALTTELAGDSRYLPILSLAGRTRTPALPEIRCRIGGFGGLNGLVAYLRAEAIDVLIDATHPFAEQISRHAAAAARATGTPHAVFTRAAWMPRSGERWQTVPDAAHAAQALGAPPRRVFLTIGNSQLAAFAAAPHHDYLIRAIDRPQIAPALPHHKFLLARGPFSFYEEVRLMRDNRISCLVSKNSGGMETRAKLDAAHELGIEVLMIARPRAVAATTFETLAETLQFLDARFHGAAPEPRGV